MLKVVGREVYQSRFSSCMAIYKEQCRNIQFWKNYRNNVVLQTGCSHCAVGNWENRGESKTQIYKKKKNGQILSFVNNIDTETEDTATPQFVSLFYSTMTNFEVITSEKKLISHYLPYHKF